MCKRGLLPKGHYPRRLIDTCSTLAVGFFYERIYMKKIEKYEKLGTEIMNLVGGDANITSVIHCMTRLRFYVKDRSLIENEKLENLHGVIGVKWVGDQLQIIIGQEVSEVHKAISAKYGFAVDEEIISEESRHNGFSFSSIINAITSCIVPVLPIITGAGLVQVLCLILKLTKVLDVTSSTYIVLNMVGNAGFYFLPVFVAWSSARHFKTSIPTAMLLGGILVHPTLVGAVVNGESLSFINIDIRMVNYASTILPIIITVLLLSKVEKLVNKYSPNVLKFMLSSFLPLVIVFPIMLWVIGPVGYVLGDYLAIAVEFIYEHFGFLAFGLFAAFYPFIIATGMHTALIPMSLNSLASIGYVAFPSVASAVSNINQGVVSLAVAVKTKDVNLKSQGLTFAFTAIVGGVTEPAMYGIYFKHKAAMIGAIIGGLVGGCVGGILKVGMYAFTGTGGIFSLPGYIGPTSANLIGAVASILVGAIVSFVVTFIMYKDVQEENKNV